MSGKWNELLVVHAALLCRGAKLFFGSDEHSTERDQSSCKRDEKSVKCDGLFVGLDEQLGLLDRRFVVTTKQSREVHKLSGV